MTPAAAGKLRSSLQKNLEGRAPSRPIIFQAICKKLGANIRRTSQCANGTTYRSLFSSRSARRVENHFLLILELNEILLKAWRVAPVWMTGRYIVMPDHVHLFCAPGDLIAQPLMTWVKYWKSNSARHWPHCGDAPIWQRHFWDTQLRRGENYDAKWEYVMANPVRAGL